MILIVKIFPLPEPLISKNISRIMSLRDGTKKMSKSEESDYSRINLKDTSDEINKKIKSKVRFRHNTWRNKATRKQTRSLKSFNNIF